jgi:hypothetical protein
MYLNPCIHSFIHTYTHTYTQKYIHTHIHSRQYLVSSEWLSACAAAGTVSLSCDNYEVTGCNLSQSRVSQRIMHHTLPPREARRRQAVVKDEALLSPCQLNGRRFCIVGTLQGSGFGNKGELVQLLCLAGADVKEGPPRHGEESTTIIVVGNDVRQPERINAWREAGAAVVHPLFVMDAVSKLNAPRVEEYAVRVE